MNIKKLLCIMGAWILSVALATAFAVNAVKAQNLLPPPPVLSVLDPSVARLEIKLDSIERKLATQNRMLKAIYVKLFPLKMEQGVIDAPSVDE